MHGEVWKTLPRTKEVPRGARPDGSTQVMAKRIGSAVHMRRTIMTRLKLGILLAASLFIAVQSSASHAEDTLRLAIGQHGNWDTAVSELGQRAGIFAKHGLNLDIIYTQGTGETLQATIGGRGALGAFSKGAPIRAIASASTGASDLFWYVPADSPIKTFTDTSGKNVAISTNGSSTHTVLLGLERRHGVKVKTVPSGSPSPTFTLVMSGQIDVGWSSPPFALDALGQKKIRIVARGSEVPELADQTVRLIVVSTGVLGAKKPLLQRYLAAYRETLDWLYGNPAGLKAYSEWAGIPEELTKQLPTDFYPKDMMLPERISGIDKVMADAVTFKYLSAPLPEEKLREFFQVIN
jgi:NitT/TauT family transport system substrate-binding protein